MQNISNIIEQFILSTMGEDDSLNLSRNELAQFFNCAPSQINYVLQTRFNLNRGFIVESQRGGGGYIRVYKIIDYDNSYIKHVIDTKLDKPISFKDAMFILEDLNEKDFVSQEQVKTISYAISPKALSMPVKLEDNVRSSILKNILINLINN